MTTSEEDEDRVRFDGETFDVEDPFAPVGEVIPPEDDDEEEFEFDSDDFITPELVAGFLTLPANMMARKTGEDWWRLEEEEVELLGKSSTPGIKYLVKKYLSGAAGPLGGLAASVLVVYGPRIMRQAQEMKAKKEKPGSRPNSSQESASSSVNASAENQPSSSEFNVLYEE